MNINIFNLYQWIDNCNKIEKFSILVLQILEMNGGNTCPLIVGIFCSIHMLSAFNHSTIGNRREENKKRRDRNKFCILTVRETM